MKTTMRMYLQLSGRLHQAMGVRDIIRLYDPKKTTLQMITAFSRHTKPHIIATLEYLGVVHET